MARRTVNIACDATAAAKRSNPNNSRKAQEQCPAVKEACKTLGSAHHETKSHTLGLLVFGGLLFAAGAAAWSLPLLFVLFAVICLPWRVVSFYRQKWVFYLIDFCYFVNIATVIFLLWYPNDLRFEALVYALADGPLAGALAAWQCPWVFSSSEHTVSVLMHLLPGLAVFAHRYHTPSGLRGWQGICQYVLQLLHGHVLPIGFVPTAAAPDKLLLWLVAAPLLFYITWQALYFLIVQVLFRQFIRRNNYETSYTCLARRAAKTNNFWNRLVRRGSITRRCLMYGLLQLIFTIICCTVFLPTYFSYPAAFLFQVVKVVFPVYYGSRYQMTKVPQHAFLKGIQVYHAVHKESSSSSSSSSMSAADGTAAAAAAAVAAAAKEEDAKVRQSAMQLRSRSCAAEVACSSQQRTQMMPRPVFA